MRMGEQLPAQARDFISTAVDASEELADQLASSFRVDVDDVSEVAAKLAGELRRDAFLKANGAKFERELYEKYGVLKDVILHPTVQVCRASSFWFCLILDKVVDYTLPISFAPALMYILYSSGTPVYSVCIPVYSKGCCTCVRLNSRLVALLIQCTCSCWHTHSRAYERLLGMLQTNELGGRVYTGMYDDTMCSYVCEVWIMYNQYCTAIHSYRSLCVTRWYHIRSTAVTYL